MRVDTLLDQELVYKLSRDLAGLKSYRHLRHLSHECASQDGMSKQIDLADRGFWASTNIQRYRRKAPYLRRLRDLIADQVQIAHSSPKRIVMLLMFQRGAKRARKS